MKHDYEFLSEAEIIRIAERERAKVIAQFFTRLFHREDHGMTPAHPVAAE